MIPFHQTHSN